MELLGSPLLSNLLYLLLVAGVWMAALAIVSPGTGVLEVIAFFALAGAGLGTLVMPLNGWAVVVLIMGAVLLVMSLRLKYSEVWLGLSALAFSLGSVFLFRMQDGGLAVHPLLASAVSILTFGYFGLAVRKAIAAHRREPILNPALVMGQIGRARTSIDPTGSVYVGGELWTARAESPIEAGTNVRVRDRDGLILTVEPIETSTAKSSEEGG